MSEILSVKNLRVILSGETILEDVSFGLEENDTLAIVGPNGSGKTVLLKTLLGMFPREGAVEWAAGIRVGYVPQKIDADRHLPLNLSNLLAAKADILGVPHSQINNVIRSVNVAPALMRTPIGHLSGGEFQKALIAFALLGKPNVLILDEPTASIDQRGEDEIYRLLHTLQDEYALTMILVSHDLSVVYRYASQVLCLNKRLICFGTPTEVLTPKNLEKLYGASRKFYHHLHNHDLH